MKTGVQGSSKKEKKRLKKRAMFIQIADALKDLDVVVTDFNINLNDKINKKPTITIKLAHKYKKD